jgi:uncharacterized phage protein (TIGR02218 family)
VKTIASGLLSHIQGEVLTLNTCVLVTRTDGAIFGYTDCDTDLIVSGQLYKASTGVITSQNTSADKFTVDQVEITSFLDSSEMTEADVMAGKWDYAAVSMFQVNRNNPSAGVYHMRDGLLGQVAISSPIQFKAEHRGLAQFLQKNIGHPVTPTCRWDLYSNSLTPAPGQPWGMCQVDPTAYAVTGVAVTSVTNNQAFHASSLGQPATYFQGGTLTWTSGANNGRSMDIQASATAGSIVLQLPMLNNIGIGDTFTIYPGCQKRFSQDCVAKFSNGLRFGGFKDLPGLDKIMRPGGV